ncbi:Exocyst complex component S5 [Coemansia sp. RSA 1813]|nr:Exocyst complex component S5 [Coemansia sp. RSA 1646]KAJ1771255.1 Exocyst complex component S5 [Coemansia sp. RSA 1843]KAJ2092824.1 Exocyst complex component S5 [Coemansia sp. RSA 986]KAJ2217676.1 Exocyst complex component S5 [Coemansia sp. RSA 487]KAJ2573086.1 Exocyst complex component S5 [Coemansia sp. RSA 1813]
MPPIEDAEILARYGLDSFSRTSYGDGGGGGSFDDSERLQGVDSPRHARHNHGRENSTGERRGRHAGNGGRSGSYGDGGGQYEGEYDDEDDDYDDDDDDGSYRNNKHMGSVTANGVAMHGTPISDRDPLHVYRSVSAVLESKGDPHALSDMSYRAKFSISSKNFSPASYMQVVHGDTPYADLVQGARLLRESVSQGTEALKILVHNNFDSFVDARNKIDLLYEEMKSRSLNEQAEYGTRAFGESLQGATQRADEIYNPIIDRRARVEKIRSTLSVVERYKFYFNLPSSLIEYTRKGRFDIAVREYKKGRQLLQTVTNGDIESTSEAMADDPQSNALSKIFQYVWKEVQESVVELRNALFRHLEQPSHAYSEQETIIRHLIDIDPGEKDPVAYYLERQHTWIVDKMESIYRDYKQVASQSSSQQMQAERRRALNQGTAGSGTASPVTTTTTPGIAASGDRVLDAERRSDELTRALNIDSFADFPAFSRGRDIEFHRWKLIYNTLRSLSQEVVRCLPDFWKLSQAYMEELYQKPAATVGRGRRRRQGLNLEKVSKCHSLLEEIIEKYSQYVLRLMGILSENESIVSIDSLKPQTISTMVQRLPQTHALLSGHFMTAIVELVVNTANDIEAIDMAQEPAIILANLISQLKAGLELFLCEMWDRDACSMYLHENWCLHHGTSYWPPFYISRRDRQNVDGSPNTFADIIANTELLPLVLRTAQIITGQLSTIHSATLQPGKSTRTMIQGQTPHFDANFDEGQRLQSERSHEMHDMAIDHVKRTFFGTMYSFLDTLHMLAFSTPTPLDIDRIFSYSDSADRTGSFEAMPVGAASDASSHTSNVGAMSSAPSLQAPRSRGIPRRFSFNLPKKNDNRATAVTAAASATHRHSIADTSRQEQGRISARHSTRSFYVLATLCNLTAFRLFVVPDLLHCKAVRSVFKLDVTNDLPQLEKMLRRLDEMIFSYYIRDKAKQLSSIVNRGVLMGGFSWSTTELPKDTQPYVSEALLYLVFTHAEIMDLIAEVGAGEEHHMVKQQPLTKRVFQVLAENLAQDMLESIRSIDSFSVGGMLQCILESLFISQTLQMYMTAGAKECFRLLFSYVRSAFERTQERAKKAAAQQGRQPQPADNNLREENGIALSPEHWDIVNQLLRDCTRRTQIQFRCFQQSPEPNA